MSGRLTLSWANKDRALLSRGDSGYEWVDREDPRVREVRLLDEIGLVGEVSGDAADNMLIRGDSVDALRAIVRTPELAAEYRGRVKLVYIDPPFNTGQAFEHYDDSLEHSVWLGMMRERLVLIRDLLAPDGSVWVHLDDAEMAYCRVLMDEVFGRSNFVATVVWEKTDSPRMDAQRFSSAHDSLLVFASSEAWEPNRQEAELRDSDFPLTDSEGRRYSRRELRKWGSNSLREDRPTLWYPIVAPDGTTAWPVRPDGREGYWRWRESQVMEQQDRIDWVEKNGEFQPYVKTYAEGGKRSIPPKTIWRVELIGGNPVGRDEQKRLFVGCEPFSTPKPERLLERVIHIGSNPGDIVLDCFAGSGTTAAVAHKMGRRWITVELNEGTADTFTKPRLEKVVAGTDPGGITESAGWTGGGGFRDLRVAGSIWDVIIDDLGTAVFQAEGVDDATLARSVAAQLGYELMEHPVFTGRKGRSRLVVAAGVVDAIGATDIASALAEGETALVAALSNTEDAPGVLADLRPGSRILRMPSQLFPGASRVTR